MDLAWLLVMYIHLTGATAQREAVHTDRFETREACVAAAQQVQFELAARIRWSCIQRGGRPPVVKGNLVPQYQIARSDREPENPLPLEKWPIGVDLRRLFSPT